MKINLGVALSVIAVIGAALFLAGVPLLAYQGLLPLSTYASLFPVLFSWPVAFTIVSLLFLSRFRDAVDYFLRNISLMKLPGGVEIQAQAKSLEALRTPESESQLVPSPEQQEQINQLVRELEDKERVSNEVRQQIEQNLQEAANAAWFWKYQYLNLYFVPSTKQVLLWFSNIGLVGTSRRDFHSAWTKFIPAQEQRDIILDVLVEQEMLEATGLFLRISPVGYSFLQFIGLLPYAPQPQAA